MSLALKSLKGSWPIVVDPAEKETVVNIDETSYEVSLASAGSGQSPAYEASGPSLATKSLSGSNYVDVATTSGGTTLEASFDVSSLNARYEASLVRTNDGTNQVDVGTGKSLVVKNIAAGNGSITITQGTLGQGNSIKANEPSPGPSHILSLTRSSGGFSITNGADIPWNSILSSSVDLQFASGGTQVSCIVAGDYLIAWAVALSAAWTAGKMGLYVDGSPIPSHSYGVSQVQRGNALIRLAVGQKFSIRAVGTPTFLLSINGTYPTSCWLFARRLANLK